MYFKLLTLYMTYVITGSSLGNNVFDNIEKQGGNISYYELERIVISHPKIALHLLQMMTENAMAKINNDLVKKDNEIVNYKIQNLETEYNETLQELELSRVICTSHFLGHIYGNVAVWWGPYPDCGRKVNDFYFDPNYHKCFQYFNYTGTPNNVSDEVISKLKDETIPEIQKARKKSFKAMNNLDEDQLQNRKKFCDLIEKRGYSIHDFCWVYWKGWQIRGAMVHEVNSAMQFAKEFKVEKYDLVCPHFKAGRLMYKDEDVHIINLMLELHESPNRIAIKNGSPIVDEC